MTKDETGLCKRLRTWLFHMIKGLKFLRKIKHTAYKTLAKTDLWERMISKLIWKKYYFRKDLLSYFAEQKDNNPHRKYLLKEILGIEDAHSYLEFGCGIGTNLYLIYEGKKGKKCNLYGIDLSKKAIKMAKKLFAIQRITAYFFPGGLGVISKFSNKSIDVLYTDASFMYVPVQSFNNYMDEFFRVAKKAIIFCEWDSESTDSGFYHYAHFVYNYKFMLEKYKSSDIQRITKKELQETMSEVSGWCEFGTIVVVILKQHP